MQAALAQTEAAQHLGAPETVLELRFFLLSLLKELQLLTAQGQQERSSLAAHLPAISLPSFRPLN